jgi:transposase-like protein
MSLQRTKFTAEFKAEAAALVRRTGHSANQIAKDGESARPH